MADKTWAEQLPKRFRETLSCGGVFHVHVHVPLLRGHCLIFTVEFILAEGTGERFSLNFANHPEDGSIPTQVELLLMDIDCAPTWSWHLNFVNSGGGMYIGEFAHYSNYKCVSDSRADQCSIVP